MPATFGVILPALQKCPHSTHLLAVRRIGIHAPKILRAVQPALDNLDRSLAFGCGFHGNALPRKDRIGTPDCENLSEEMQRTHSPPGKPLSSFQDFSEWSVVKRRPSPQSTMNQEYCTYKPFCRSREEPAFSASFSHYHRTQAEQQKSGWFGDCCNSRDIISPSVRLPGLWSFVVKWARGIVDYPTRRVK
jgi:hypothetical protein